MPKEEKVETKKKMVVVEEVPSVVTESPKVENKIDVPVVTETTDAELEKAINTEPKLDPETELSEEKTNYLWIIIPTALLIGALVGGLITYFSGLSKLSTENATPSPVASIAPEVEATPTASPSSTFKKAELKIQVLNGSGVSGAAGKAKTLLEAAGYETVDTGNASVSDLAQTEIAIKADKKEYLDAVIKDLAKSYSAVEATKPLVATSKFDVVITIGKK